MAADDAGSARPLNAWWRARALSERLPRRSGDAATLESGEARAKLERWRGEFSRLSTARFEARLAAADLDENMLLAVLADSTPPQEAGETATWSRNLERWLGTAASYDPEAPPHREGLGFAAFVEPFVSAARERARATFAELDPKLLGDTTTLENALVEPLFKRAIGLAIRTLVLELNVARLEERLEGDTPEQRYRSFAASLSRPEVRRAIFEEYPVLARQLAVLVEEWSAADREMLERFADDREDLTATFATDGKLGRLVDLTLGAGDRHRGGHAVGFLHFDSDVVIVYKPRSIAAEVHYGELLGWLGERGLEPRLRRLALLDRGTHSWMEYALHEPAEDAAALGRFFTRQGIHLAVLYALDAVDMHSENLVAAGEDPILVDLEALFHPLLRRTSTPRSLSRRAQEILASSVARTGLLPERIGVAAGQGGADLSGLGAKPGQLTPTAVPTYRSLGSDTMYLARERVPMPGRRNRPSLDDSEVDPLDYAQAILDGFASAYRLLVAVREELLSDAGPLARFRGAQVRTLLRGTRAYGELIEESMHPNLLRDGLDRERFLDRLWFEVGRRPELEVVVEIERAELWRGDIPLFTTTAEGRDLDAGRGRVLPCFFAESGLERARLRIASMGEADLDRQLWFARAALATLAARPRPIGWPRDLRDRPTRVADPGDLLARADAIARRLSDLAVIEGEQVTWFGLATHGTDRPVEIAPVEADLYAGLAGIALFLAHHGALAGDTQGVASTALARGALAALRPILTAARETFTPIGAFCGWGGVAYAFLALSDLWRDETLAQEAEAAAEHLLSLIERDDRWDVLYGSAGAILILLRFARRRPDPRWLDGARRCGERLIEAAIERGGGIGWQAAGAPDRAPLGGLSHGASGIAWALAELGAATGEERFWIAAQRAILYERGLFSPEKRAWRDLRHVAGDHVALAWCHGAPGIGLARALTLAAWSARPGCDRGEIEVLRKEIAQAVETTLAQGFGHGHSLCHGDLGNALALFTIAGRTGDRDLGDRVGRLATCILASRDRDGWQTGVPLAAEVPGLFEGLAGIGYALLRLAAPERVPCVLSLEPMS